MTSDPEGAWIRAAGCGDREAFARLVGATRAGVWRMLRTLTRDESAAEDALQETYVAVWRSAGTYRGDARGRAWLYGLARRHAARTWRRRAGEPADPVPLQELGAQAGWGRSPEEVAAASEDRERLVRALAALSPQDRDVIVLIDLEGFTAPEVGEMLGATANAVRVRLHRAHLRLMATLREETSDA